MRRFRFSTAAFIVVFHLVAGGESARQLQGQGQQAVLTPWLETAIRQGSAEERHSIWVYFRDKGSNATARSLRSLPVSARALARRARRSRAAAVTPYEDLALVRSYTEQVAARVTRVRHELRWLNAMSVEATPAQVRALAALPFVARLDVVRGYRGGVEPAVETPPLAVPDLHGSLQQRFDTTGIDYGTSLNQVAQLRIPELHERGLTGEGVVVAVFDTGFPNLGHEAFAAMKIVAERVFVDGVATVSGTNSHGTATLSVLGGFRAGQLVGPAFGASFVLAVTEDARSETPVEEDNWAAAAEWAEALGVDVISSSLGYARFDLPYSSYTDRDMNGATAVTTIAATMAAARGIVVVSSAGNGGFNPNRNTLVAPADGRYVLAAGAVDRNGIRAPFSSIGPTADGRIKPDLAAQGVSVKVATTVSPRSYGFAGGTSFSCPLIAGVVALVLQAHPGYTVNDVIQALRTTSSQSLAPDNLLGWGTVDAVAAVDVERRDGVQPPAREDASAAR